MSEQPNPLGAFVASIKEKVSGRPVRIGLMMLIGFAVSLTGPGGALLAYLLGGPLEQANLAFLKSVRAEAEAEMVLLGASYAALEVLSSIDFGISFIVETKIEIGRIVTEISQLMKSALEITGAKLAVSLALTYVVEASGALSNFFLKATLLLLALHAFCATVPALTHPSLACQKLGRIAAMAFLFFQVALPYGLHGTALISTVFLDAPYAENHASLKSIHGLHADTGGGLKDSAHIRAKQLAAQARHLPAQRHQARSYRGRHMALLLIEAALLPFFILLAQHFLRRMVTFLTAGLVPLQNAVQRDEDLLDQLADRLKQ